MIQPTRVAMEEPIKEKSRDAQVLQILTVSGFVVIMPHSYLSTGEFPRA
jgi:hypothetical protein